MNSVIDYGTEEGRQAPPARIDLYYGEILLGTFPVRHDEDIQRTLNACPIALSHYVVSLARD